LSYQEEVNGILNRAEYLANEYDAIRNILPEKSRDFPDIQYFRAYIHIHFINTKWNLSAVNIDSKK